MKNIVFALDIEENTAIYFVSEAVAPYRDVKKFSSAKECGEKFWISYMNVCQKFL